MYNLLFLLFCGLSLTTFASTPMELEIHRQLDQIRTIGEHHWSQRIEQERGRKEEQVSQEPTKSKIVQTSPRPSR